jgi:tight adherence protein C
MEPMTPLVFALVAAAVLLGFAGLKTLAGREAAEVRDRVQRIAHASPLSASARGWPSTNPIVRWLSAPAGPHEAEGTSRVASRLSYAGLHNPHALELFLASKVILAVLLGAATLVLSATRTRPVNNVDLLAAILAGAGFYLPDAWLQRRIDRVQRELVHALPDALDLMTSCIEAGLGLEAAIQRIGREIGLAAPRLAGELELTLAEIQAGLGRSEAFRRLAKRTGVEDLRILAAIVSQTEMFGTSIANALRANSSSLRVRRTHLAEENAAKSSVQMLLPLIFFILPSLLVIILGPAVLRIMRTVMASFGGGP